MAKEKKKTFTEETGKQFIASFIVYCLAFGIMVFDSPSKPSLMFNTFFDYLLITIYFYNDQETKHSGIE